MNYQQSCLETVHNVRSCAESSLVPPQLSRTERRKCLVFALTHVYNKAHASLIDCKIIDILHVLCCVTSWISITFIARKFLYQSCVQCRYLDISCSVQSMINTLVLVISQVSWYSYY